MTAAPVTRVGICRTCGRQAPGILAEEGTSVCLGACPRCGVEPFFLDSVAPYTGNIARMGEAEAIAFIRSIESQAEVEVGFRLEIMGLDRESVLMAGIDRYIELDEDPALCRRQVWRPGVTLDSLRGAWLRELKDPGSRRMYSGLLIAE